MIVPRISNWLQHSAIRPALLSSLLCWLAFPPVGWGWLAYLAPIGWLLPITWEILPGRRAYRGLWVAGFAFWMLTVHWIRLPHPANYLALVVLATYLGCYLPMFVALSRVGVHRMRLPLWLVAPVVWTGLDWIRAHLMTGFLMGSLAHTQVKYPLVIQIADLVGEYGVTFVVVMVAALLTCAICQYEGPRRHLPLAAVAIVLACCVGYGSYVSETIAARSTQETPSLRVALIQGNTLAEWKADENRQTNIMREYMDLTRQAIEQSNQQDGQSVDLVIWPETSFRQNYVTVEPGYQPPSNQIHESYLVAGQRDLATFVDETGAAILTGIDRVHIFPDKLGQPDYVGFNSSVLMDKQKSIVGTYDKMHRVPFGEYIPLAEWFPVLYRITPLTGGVQPGAAPATLPVGELLLSPNICYESCVPHLIRRHVNHRANAVPDVMVNLTNDSWYWGSSELEQHLACGIFRAVEHHIPLIVAANGGLSAQVDALGQVQQIKPRQQTAVLLVDLGKRGSSEPSWYARVGDWFAVLCMLCCMVLAIQGWRYRASPQQ